MSTDPERLRSEDLHGWFKAFGPSDARSVLGPNHPLTRSTELVHTLAVQAIATAPIAAIGAIAAADRQPWAATLLAVAVFVELIVLAILALSCELRRERVLRMIASNSEPLPLAEVGREERRLMNAGHRSALADRLERALDQARRWHQITVASRPPEGVKLLSAFASEVEEIADLLRTSVPNVRGVAVLKLCLIGGYGSALYAGDSEELQQQLWRMRYLLNPSRAPRQDTPHPPPRSLTKQPAAARPSARLLD